MNACALLPLPDLSTINATVCPVVVTGTVPAESWNNVDRSLTSYQKPCSPAWNNWSGVNADGDGVNVGVFVGVIVGVIDMVCVFDGVSVIVGVTDIVGDIVGVMDIVGVIDGVAVFVGVNDIVGDTVILGVTDGVTVFVGVVVNVGVNVGDGVGVGVIPKSGNCSIGGGKLAV